jgi:endonuclease YncB( thermonuclease family)
MGCCSGKNNKLCSLTFDNTHSLDFKGMRINAKVLRVIDGDTIVVGAYLLGIPLQLVCRCAGYNCAELRGKTEQERAAAIDAREFARDLLLERIVTVIIRKYDKYGGRYLADIEFEDGKKLCSIMVEHNHAKSYNGKGTAKWNN